MQCRLLCGTLLYQNGKTKLKHAERHSAMKTAEIKSSFGTFNVTIEKNKFISITTKATNWEKHRADENGNIVRVFKMGDMAEYDSYNLSYLGTIKSITEKTVSILPRFGNGSVRRLKVGEFCWRNYKFDMEETNAQNLATSYSI